MDLGKVESFVDFINKCEFCDILTDIIVFRGQPIRGNLLPSIARDSRKINIVEKEKQSIEQLKLLGASFLEPTPQTELDHLVVAQHFGLSTRLLDWTTNPLTALWFACSDKREGDVYVYALESHNLLVKDVYKKDPFKFAGTIVFQPRFNNPRIIAQHGWFTLHQLSIKNEEIESLEKDSKIKQYLHEICIPSASRQEMLKSLDMYGISARTLFPDLVGLCQYLNWKKLS